MAGLMFQIKFIVISTITVLTVRLFSEGQVVNRARICLLGYELRRLGRKLQ
jgi:hypothetical protein